MNRSDTFRRRIHNVLGTALMLLVVALAFALPYAAYTYEDYRLTNYDIHYMAEPVNIEAEKMSIAEKLSGMGDIIGSSSYIYVYPESLDKRDYNLILSMEDAKRNAIDYYLDVFWCNLYSKTKDSEEYNKYRKRLLKDPDMYIQPILLIEPGLRNTFLGWYVSIEDEKYGYSQIIIDDQSGMLIAFQIDMVREDKSLSDSIAICDELGSLYGITYEGTNVMDKSEEVRISTMNLRGKTRSFQLYLVDTIDEYDAEEGFSESISYNYFSNSTVDEYINE